MKQVILIISLVIMVLNVNAQDTFNNADTTDCQYTVRVIPMNGKTVYINGYKCTVNIYDYAAPVFEYTFQNGNDLYDTLTIALNNLNKRYTKGENKYRRLEYLVEIYVMGDIYRIPLSTPIGKFSMKIFMDIVERNIIRNEKSKTYKLRCTWNYDVDGNMIYVDHNGTQFVWDYENSEYVPANLIDDL